jgi:DNA-binding NtrC family response regulator
VVALLQAQHWSGNVRELENVIERAVVLTTGDTITRDAIVLESAGSARPAMPPSLKLHQNVEWVERETIRQALERSTAKQQAARMMGISPRALSHYLSKYPSLDSNRQPKRTFGAGVASESDSGVEALA